MASFYCSLCSNLIDHSNNDNCSSCNSDIDFKKAIRSLVTQAFMDDLF
jgi:hypothetical protein